METMETPQPAPPRASGRGRLTRRDLFERFGWAGPFPPPDREARVEAERVTNEICATAFKGLSTGERTGLVALLERATEAAT